MLSNCSFEGNAQKLLGFNRKFHGELVDDFLGVAVHDESYSLFCGNSALVTIEELVFVDFRGGGFVFYSGGVVVDVHIGECVCPAFVAEQ